MSLTVSLREIWGRLSRAVGLGIGVSLFAVVMTLAGISVAQVSPEQNLRTCLDGRYPSLCDQSRLIPQQRQEVDVATRQANLKSCLDGRYPALCKHALLTPEQRAQVDAAERRANLEVCRTGKYPALCKRHLLTDFERRLVETAERQQNLATCLDGRYPNLCRKQLLTAEERGRVSEVEARIARAPRAGQPPASPPARQGGGAVTGRQRTSSCDDGLWIDRVSGNGAILVLSDGSVWRVDPVDQVTSSIWPPITDVIACDDEIINVDDGESVVARRIR